MAQSNDPFQLHPRLAQDCAFITDLPLSTLLLMNDSLYPWCILVPRVAGICDLHELDEGNQRQLLRESSLLSRCLMTLFNGHKMNVAALGNVVPQLHVHHIVRQTTDAAWPLPVWGQQAAMPYSAEQLANRIEAIATAIGQSQPET
jgi:diadenosine tetraphosphate (Ap4A) HIT family hydrolase